MKKCIFITSVALIMSIMLQVSGCYSCQSWNRLMKTGPVAPEVAHKWLWDKDCKPLAKEAPAPAPAAAPVAAAPAPKAAPASKCGAYEAMQAYPAAQCGVVKIDKYMPAEVQLNGEFEYKIKAVNLTSCDVANVVVTEHLSSNFKFQSSAPATTPAGAMAKWDLGTLAPNETKEIVVKGAATTIDCVKNCTTVDYVVPTCAFTQVVEPKLMLTKSAPEKVVICNPIPMTFTVTNNGTGDAKDVKISDTLPEGLLTADGKKQIDINVGTLKPAQSQTYTVNTIAQKTGKFDNKATAVAGAGLKAESAVTSTLVTKPVLEITKTGPKTQYLGRTVEYVIKITNTGDEVAANAMVEDLIPAGVTNIVTSQGGTVANGKAVWQLGALEPKASKTVTISYLPSAGGAFANKATATAVCAENVVASASTDVKGIPALLLEVIDITDPIEVGSNETYNIVVTNQGTAVATNVEIKCMLEDSMEYVSSSGATTGALAAEVIKFNALPTLAPKAKATWNVVIKAVKEGDVRFRVTMNSDQLDRDVEETESTNFYK